MRNKLNQQGLGAKKRQCMSFKKMNQKDLECLRARWHKTGQMFCGIKKNLASN